MNFLFIHPNFPAQFWHLSKALSMMGGNRVLYLTQHTNGNKIQGVQVALYKSISKPNKDTHLYLKPVEEAVIEGQSVAKALVELLEGQIDVESHVGFGSKFTVTIPVVEGDDEIQQLAEENTVTLPEGLRIAIVDDDVTVLRMTVEMLSKKNVQAVGCPTVNDLFDRMRQSDYDLIITDIKLGGMSGFDLLELLRDANIGNSKSVPLLAMTGRTERKAEDFINAGFSGCLLKPFSYAELTQAIANSVKEDTTFKIPKTDFTTLLHGEDDVNGMLNLLVEQTEAEINTLKSALETGDTKTIEFLQHKLETRWEILGIVKPMLRLRDALRGKCDMAKAVDEVVMTAEHLVSQAKEKMEGGAA